jgi:transposase
MRGTDTKQGSMFTVLSPEKRVPKDHPLRPLKRMCDEALSRMSPLFDAMYSTVGRPSIPPERLLKSTLLMALYTVRSERLFCEQLDYNILFRWFLDMNLDEESFDHSSFTRNRDRLLLHDIAKEFFCTVVEQARAAGLLSDDHFSVDGTLIEAWASLKSFRKKGEKPEDRPPPDDPGNPSVSFHGEKRSNATHASTTDPESKLARKSNATAAKLSYSQHALIENRNGLLVDIRVAEANGRAEREVALEMIGSSVPGTRRITVGGDKGFDTRDFVGECRRRNVTPHVAQNITKQRGSAVDGRTTRHPGYEISQRFRKRIEEVWGWTKTVANFRKTRFKGRLRTEMASYFVGAAYNLLRMSRLLPAAA